MQQRAGLLFLSIKSQKILLILEDQYWTVPTFQRSKSLLEDAEKLFEQFNVGRILPIELYTSEDKGFEYGTYVCIVPEEFLVSADVSYSWAKLDSIPKHLHSGLRHTLNSVTTKIKIETILELENASIG